MHKCKKWRVEAALLFHQWTASAIFAWCNGKNNAKYNTQLMRIFSISWVHLHTSLCSLRIYEYETAGIRSWCIVESDHKLWIVKTAKRNYVVHIPKWIFRAFCCHCRSDINTVHCICCIPSNSGTINTLHEPAEKWQHFCWCQRSKRQPTESEVKWTVWTIHNVFWASATRWNHKTINCINNYRFCHCCYTFNSMQIANFIFYI